MNDHAHHLTHPVEGLRVLLIEDNRVIRDAIASLLANDDALTEVSSTGLDTDILSTVEGLRPDIILLPAGASRVTELIRAVTRRFASIRVIVFGIKELPEPVTAVVEAGAAGYVREDASLDEFREVVRLVARGETRVAPVIASTLFSRLAALAASRRANDQAKRVRLTPRELEILRLVAEGLTNKEIAARLHVELQTIKNHMHNILERLRLSRRQQAVQYAWEAGMLHRA